MDKNIIYKVIDDLREAEAYDTLIKDRLLNYLEANIDEFIECYDNQE